MTNAVAQAPSFELDEFINRVYFYHYGAFNLGFPHRFTSFVNFDLAPSSSLRRGRFSYAYYKKKYRIRSSFSRISAEDYRTKQDIRDDLPPSALTTIKTSGRYRYSRKIQLNGGLTYGTRSEDSLKSTDLYFGGLYTGLMKKRLSLGAKFGQRDDYLSDDTYIQAQISYYRTKWNVFASLTQESESYDSGEKLSPLTINGEFAYFFSKKLRGSASFTKSDAEDRSLTSFMMMIGYQFGSDSTSPTRRRTPNFEEI